MFYDFSLKIFGNQLDIKWQQFSTKQHWEIREFNRSTFTAVDRTPTKFLHLTTTQDRNFTWTNIDLTENLIDQTFHWRWNDAETKKKQKLGELEKDADLIINRWIRKQGERLLPTSTASPRRRGSWLRRLLSLPVLNSVSSNCDSVEDRSPTGRNEGRNRDLRKDSTRETEWRGWSCHGFVRSSRYLLSLFFHQQQQWPQPGRIVEPGTGLNPLILHVQLENSNIHHSYFRISWLWKY